MNALETPVRESVSGFAPQSGLAEHPTVLAVWELCQTALAEQVDAIDRQGVYPEAILKKLGEIGALGAHLSLPGQLPDFGLAIAAMSEVSRVCGATGFMVWCHDVCGLYMEHSGNPRMGSEVLGKHAKGQTLGATGMSNPMKTFAGIENFLLHAKPVEGGFVVNGTLPWVSNLGPDHYFGALADVQDETGAAPSEVMFMVHCDAPGVVLRDCPSFSAMEGTNTWAVRLTDYFVGSERLIAAPAKPFIGRIRAAFILLQTGFGLGVTQGAIDSMFAWQQYICRACGLIYDESKGDPDSGLAPGTRFADIPDDWFCPLCGVTKQDFELFEISTSTCASRRPATGSGIPGRSRGAARARAGRSTVIVGAGCAGWQMAASLRALDSEMAITLVTQCSGDVYDKPMLSVALARGIEPEKLTKESGAAAAQRLNVKLMPHTVAVRVSPESRQLRTTRGTLRYAHLVFAHGASARQLPQFPASLAWYINHLATYRRFRAALAREASKPQRIAIVGAGLIGSELANDLALAGHAVHLLDVVDRPLATLLVPEQSCLLLKAWEALPIHFRPQCKVLTVNAEGNTKELVFEDGTTLNVDHIVVAAGLQTSQKLALTAGLQWCDGISVQAQTLMSSQPQIYALGDCISVDGQVSRYIEPIGRQARTIAANILGLPGQPYEHKPMPVRIKTTSMPFTS